MNEDEFDDFSIKSKSKDKGVAISKLNQQDLNPLLAQNQKPQNTALLNKRISRLPLENQADQRRQGKSFTVTNLAEMFTKLNEHNQNELAFKQFKKQMKKKLKKFKFSLVKKDKKKKKKKNKLKQRKSVLPNDRNIKDKETKKKEKEEKKKAFHSLADLDVIQNMLEQFIEKYKLEISEELIQCAEDIQHDAERSLLEDIQNEFGNTETVETVETIETEEPDTPKFMMTQISEENDDEEEEDGSKQKKQDHYKFSFNNQPLNFGEGQ